MVLWVLTLLSVLAGAFSMATRTHVNLARNALEGAEAEAIADAAVNRAIAALLLPAEEGSIRVDATPYAWAFADGKAVLSIEDEGGKIDINAASAEELTALFGAIGLDPRDSERLADAIIDYRDEDDDRLPNGAEMKEYRVAGKAAGPKNAPFEFLDELEGVYGMTPEVLAAVRPALTVYTGVAEPVPELAPVGAADLVTAVIAGRTGNISDDRQTALPSPQQRGTSPEQQNTPNALGLLVPLRLDGTDARSGTNVYTIHAEARTNSGAVFVRQAVVGIVPESLPPYRIFDWRQGRRQFELR